MVQVVKKNGYSIITSQDGVRRSIFWSNGILFGLFLVVVEEGKTKRWSGIDKKSNISLQLRFIIPVILLVSEGRKKIRHEIDNSLDIFYTCGKAKNTLNIMSINITEKSIYVKKKLQSIHTFYKRKCIKSLTLTKYCTVHTILTHFVNFK